MRINLPSIIACSFLGLSFLAGCASVKDYSYEQTQRMRAAAQYRECGKNNCSKYPHDYKLGWKDGFYEVATGGSSCPPAVAPQRYWNPDQILEDCDNRRHAYYSGWQDGAARASQFPDTHYLRIYESCECPFPNCNDVCLGGDCGFVSTGMMVDDGMVESPELATQAVIEQIDSAPMPPAPITAEDADNDESGKPAESKESDNSDKAAEAEPLPEPTPEANANANTNATPKADYNFLEDGGVVIDFTSDAKLDSPSDAPVVSDAVAELDFTFGDEDINDEGLIEFDEE